MAPLPAGKELWETATFLSGVAVVWGSIIIGLFTLLYRSIG
jgi:hypothetical protein